MATGAVIELIYTGKTPFEFLDADTNTSWHVTPGSRFPTNEKHAKQLLKERPNEFAKAGDK